MVGIEYRNELYWLSGSGDTWNQESANTVCRQLHCGEATNYTAYNRSDIENNWDVWDKSYNCSSNRTALFECESAMLPPNYNATVAMVKCSGNMRKYDET